MYNTLYCLFCILFHFKFIFMTYSILCCPFTRTLLVKLDGVGLQLPCNFEYCGSVWQLLKGFMSLKMEYSDALFPFTIITFSRWVSHYTVACFALLYLAGVNSYIVHSNVIFFTVIFWRTSEQVLL